MPTTTLLELALNNGVGVFIALIVILWKRQDDKENAEALKARALEEQAEKKALADILRANTEALLALKSSIESAANITILERKLAEMEKQIDRRERQP